MIKKVLSSLIEPFLIIESHKEVSIIMMTILTELSNLLFYLIGFT